MRAGRAREWSTERRVWARVRRWAAHAQKKTKKWPGDSEAAIDITCLWAGQLGLLQLQQVS
jgi:hypothetical protein